MLSGFGLYPRWVPLRKFTDVLFGEEQVCVATIQTSVKCHVRF